MRKLLLIGSAAAILLTTGCAEMSDTQRRTAIGAGAGALGGAAIGAVTGGKAGTGAVIGAGVGALGTYIWSQHMEKQKQEMKENLHEWADKVMQGFKKRLRESGRLIES